MSKNTIIFGGTKGIGKVICEYLKEKQYNVITVSRQKMDSTNHITLDLSVKDEIKKILNEYLSKGERIKYVIFSQRYRGSEITEHFNVSLFSIIESIEILKDKFEKNASVVFIQSQARKYVLNDHDLDYHLIQSAIQGLLRFYAVKFGKKQIRFNSISTMTIKKPENNKFYNNVNPITKLLRQTSPLNRMGDAKDIAMTAEFLCSDKSNFITGQTIDVNGGIDLYSHEVIAKRKIENKKK